MPKVQVLPAGPEDVHFQTYSFESYLGESPSVRKGLDLTQQQVRAENSITDIVCRDLADAYRYLTGEK